MTTSHIIILLFTSLIVTFVNIFVIVSIIIDIDMLIILHNINKNRIESLYDELERKRNA